MVLSRTRAHLDENESSVVFRNQINLAFGSAPVALQNSKATFL